MLRAIAREAALEDDVLGQGDALVNSKPVADQQHEILQDRLEVAVAWDSDRAVNDRADEGPDETGNALGDARKELQGQRDGVDIRAVVGNDGEGEDDEAELSKAAKGWDEHSSEEATDAGGLIAGVVGVGLVQRDGRCNSGTQHLSEEERESKAAKCP